MPGIKIDFVMSKASLVPARIILTMREANKKLFKK
jgi:hypothetical protein